jgi:hypothetical protein
LSIVKKLIVIFSVFTALFSGVVWAYQFDFGALRTDNFYEDKLSFGLQNSLNQTRAKFQIPRAYGKLVTVTQANKQTTLWFEAADGSIRNVNLDANNPLIVERKGELAQ